MSSDLRVYVIDTNIILNNYLAPFTLKNAHVILPQIVINELDRKKDYMENRSAAYNARAFCNRLKKLIKENNGIREYQINPNLKLTILPTDLDQTDKDMKQLGLDPSKADSIIVSTAWRIAQTEKDVIVLTNDTNMWITCVAVGLSVEEHESQKNTKESQGFYTGVKTLVFEGTEVDDFYMSGLILNESDHPGLYPNQILVLKSEGNRQSSAIAMFNGYGKNLKRLKDHKHLQFAGISPLNKEQGFAYHLLDNEKIACVTLAGRAGTGKSIVTLSYGIEGLNKGLYDKIIVLKPVVPVGKDIGFLPGTMEEKLLPWMESFRDSLDIIFAQDTKEQGKDGQTFPKDNRDYDFLVENGMLEFLPLTFMRGRSIQRSLIILDEAQNTSIHEMKTLLTRVGEGSKIVLLGDVDQIDAPWLSIQNNGLSYLIEKGAESELVGHITLIKSLRSPLADWASSNL